MDLLLNPAAISILLLCILCVKNINVLLAIFFSTVIAGLLAKMNITEIMNVFISGMGNNSETALSYILLGAFAATMAHSGITGKFAEKFEKVVNNKKYILFTILVLVAMASQNIIPIHIAFIPIIIPPLLKTMNKLKIDRRAVSCVLAFGLKMPYITIPVGFGLIFQNLIADNMIQNGAVIAREDVWKYTLILGFAMVFGLMFAIFISYRKPRIYKNQELLNTPITKISETECSKRSVIIISIAAILTFVVQVITHSLPLGALVGLGIIFTTKIIPKNKMDNMMNEGVYLMGYIAFVMLVAAGFASVLKATGSIDGLVNSVIAILPDNMLVIALIMLILGLFITIGIGTSFGTIPILAVLFVPVCLKSGFNTAQIAMLLSAAAALGDAGSPASDTTLGPTSGLNADGQHNHIFDTCIPTFLHYNISLILFALIGIYLLAA
ncbi:MAG: sodium:proton antiporter [bacterium]|nr:sodium:proton antiporter [bacterium]